MNTTMRHAGLFEDRPRLGLPLLAGLVFAAAVACAQLARLTPYVALVWPVNAIVLNALLRSSRRRWIVYVPAAFAAIGAANLMVGDQPAVALALGACNVIEIFVAAFIMRALDAGPVRQGTPCLKWLAAMAAAVAVASVSSATMAAALLRSINMGSFSDTWVRWLVSDVLGLLTVTPALLSVSGAALRTAARKERVRDAVVICAVAAVTSAVFANRYPLQGLVLLALTAAAFAASFAGTTLAVLAAGAVAMTATAHGNGPYTFMGGGPIDHMLMLGIAFSCVAVTTITVNLVLGQQLKAERRQRKTDEQVLLLAHALRSASDCISITDTDDRILYVNEAFIRTYEYDERELLGRHIRMVRSADNDPEIVAGILPATKRDGWRGVIWNKSKTGRVFPVSLATSMVRDEQGRDIAAIGVARDITHEQAAEKARRASEEKFEKIFRASPDCIAICDTGPGGLLEVNDRFEAITGLSRREILGRTIADLGLLVDPTISDQWHDQLRRTGSVRDFEYQLRGRGGEIFTIMMSADTIDVGGRPCFLSVHRDISDRKRAAEALRRTETKYRELFENANDIVFTVDRYGHYVSMNRAGERITGYTSAESSGKHLAQLVAAEHAELAERQLQRVLAGEDVPAYELDVITRSGARVTLELATRPVYEGGVAVAVQGIARDVTHRNELEAQLRQAQKMQAIGSLAGGIAHDFNNLLSVVIGYAELARQPLEATSTLRKDLDEIVRAARSAESLTRQLLIFSRKDVIQPVVLDLNDLVGRLDKMLRRIIGEQIEFVVRLDPEVGHIMADAGQIEQVIMNLVVNARDAMPRGGILTVETDRADVSQAFAHSHAGLAAGTYVRLTVSDTGVGMTPDVQGQIFTPFFTTKGPAKGTGLGLATVHGIVQQANGYISVHSAPGQGTTFSVYLPYVDTPVEPVEVIAPTPASDGPAETVLLVEDDDSVRMLGVRVLRLRGYTVLPARHAEEAIDVANRFAGAIDLLLTDVVMPGLDGAALAQRLRQSRASTRVLYASGYTDDVGALRDIQTAGAHFLRKPYTPDALAQSVRRVLSRSPAQP